MNESNNHTKAKASFPLSTSSNRCKYNVSTLTTSLQMQTEDECCPFFVDIPSLPKSQIDHLRQVGLLPRVESPVIPYGDIIDVTNTLDLSEVNATNEDDLQNLGKEDSERSYEEWDDEKASVGQLHLKDYNSVRNLHPKRTETKLSSTNASQYSNEEKEQKSDPHQFDICLMRSKHVEYCLNALVNPLPSSYFSLDASRPWMIYWNLHSLDLLNALPEPSILINVVNQLELCWQEFPVEGNKRNEQIFAGGYGGGPGQMAHCATTYAAVLALCIIAGCYDPSNIDSDPNGPKTLFKPTYKDASTLAQSTLLKIRPKLYRFFYTLRTPINIHDNTNSKTNPVGFSMHLDGESDVRGTYTVIAISHLLHILTPQLVKNVSNYIIACQTYEGGFGGEPLGTEAHGGYTFCAIAALFILKELKNIRDKSNLMGWLARRQMEYEGGYSGRSNKLVDGCYSFWIGASSALVVSNQSSEENDVSESFMQDQALERYLLLCGQCVEGGLRDKPSKNRDFYHTCYGLSGLSTAQHFGHSTIGTAFGHPSNTLEKTDPALNIGVDRVKMVMSFFMKQGLVVSDEGFSGIHEELSSFK